MSYLHPQGIFSHIGQTNMVFGSRLLDTILALFHEKFIYVCVCVCMCVSVHVMHACVYCFRGKLCVSSFLLFIVNIAVFLTLFLLLLLLLLLMFVINAITITLLYLVIVTYSYISCQYCCYYHQYYSNYYYHHHYYHYYHHYYYYTEFTLNNFSIVSKYYVIVSYILHFVISALP